MHVWMQASFTEFNMTSLTAAHGRWEETRKKILSMCSSMDIAAQSNDADDAALDSEPPYLIDSATVMKLKNQLQCLEHLGDTLQAAICDIDQEIYSCEDHLKLRNLGVLQ